MVNSLPNSRCFRIPAYAGRSEKSPERCRRSWGRRTWSCGRTQASARAWATSPILVLASKSVRTTALLRTDLKSDRADGFRRLSLSAELWLIISLLDCSLRHTRRPALRCCVAASVAAASTRSRMPHVRHDGLAVDADGTSAEGHHVEEPTRHHQILVEVDHVVLVSDRQMHAKGGANT